MNLELNLPKAELIIKNNSIWDVLRKKYVKLTPEEWVRQHFIHYLITHLNWPIGLMASEHKVNYNNMAKRCDIVSFTKNLNPLLIVECKAPSIALNEDIFYQIAKYNFTLKAPFLILTNGIDHVMAFVNKDKKEIQYLENILDYNQALALTHNF